VLLVVASRQITFVAFGADLLTNISNFAQWIVDLGQRFNPGAGRS
jgi:hypothetical protein